MEEKFKQMLDALTREGFTYTSKIRDLNSVINQYNDPIKKEIKEYEKHLAKIQKHRKTDSNNTVEMLKDFKKQQLLRQMSLEVKTQEIKAQKGQIRQLQKQIKQQQEIYDQLAKIDGKYAESTLLASNNLDNLQKELSKMKVNVKDSNSAYKNTQKEIDKLADLILTKEKELKRFSISTAMSNVGEKIGNTIDSHLDKVFSSDRIGKGVDLFWQGMRSEVEAGFNVSDTAAQMNIESQLGLTRDQLVGLVSEFRRTILVTGGLTESQQILLDSQKILSGNLSEAADRTKVTIKWMNVLANNGMKPLTSDINRVQQSMDILRSRTSILGKEYIDLMADVMEQEGLQNLMKAAATEQERRAIVRNTEALVNHLATQGLNTKQIKETTLALNKMAARPKTRFQEAAELQRMFGMLGMSRQGARAAELHRLGEERMARMGLLGEYQVIMKDAANILKESRVGSVPSEFMLFNEKTETAVNLLEKFAQSQMEAQKTQIDASLKVAEQQNKVTEAQEKFVKALNDFTNFMEKSPWINITAGVVGGLVGGKLLGKAGGKIRSLFSKKMPTATVKSGGDMTKRMSEQLSKQQAAKTAASAAVKWRGAAAVGKAVLPALRAVPYLGTALTLVTAADMIASATTKKMKQKSDTPEGKAEMENFLNENPWMRGNAPKPSVLPAETKKAISVESQVQQTADETKEATEKSSTSLDEQLRKMDATNILLAKMNANVEKQVDLTEKQVMLTSLTDTEKQDAELRKALLGRGRSPIAFNYVK